MLEGNRTKNGGRRAREKKEEEEKRDEREEEKERIKKVAEEIEMRGARDRERTSEKEDEEEIGGERERGRDGTVHVTRHCEGGRILTPARTVRLGILPRNSHRLNELYSIRAKFGMHARSFREGEIGEFLEKSSHTLNRTSSCHCAPP